MKQRVRSIKSVESFDRSKCSEALALRTAALCAAALALSACAAPSADINLRSAESTASDAPSPSATSSSNPNSATSGTSPRKRTLKDPRPELPALKPRDSNATSCVYDDGKVNCRNVPAAGIYRLYRGDSESDAVKAGAGEDLQLFQGEFVNADCTTLQVRFQETVKSPEKEIAHFSTCVYEDPRVPDLIEQPEISSK